ncbi:unnamed protein product [Bursaphelenchus okinawaensis]|uniref:G-protein coupled receptors family 1 profile domain-containing protein n=1 Tax=Bursaphelenchus okinawaensis TaxID=465554 RepID=A0A811LRY8_9BILA|nr:unnamed protein product [Bursaphelenchus okinawaensis]CAG9127065.1 unnamed protein product [Bursaphelenchus okinawaensis]
MESNISTAIVPEQDDTMLLAHPYVRLFFLVMYLTVFVTCVCGNLVILVVIITDKAMRTTTNFFLANLAVADLLVGIFCVFQNAVHFVLFEHGTWPFGRMMCHSYIYILHMIPNASAGILVLLSIERFIAVIRPMFVHHLFTKGVLVLSAVLVWLFSALMNLPYLIAVHYKEVPNKVTGSSYAICTRRFLKIQDIDVLKVVTTLNLIIWYIVPLLILLVIYITIGFVLMRTTEDNSVARSSQNKSVTSSNSSRSSRKLPRLEAVDSRKKVIRLVVVIVLCFALLSLPRYLYLSWSVFRLKNAPRCLNCLAALIQPLTFLFLFINSGVNPILYAFLSQRFRSAIANMFVCSTAKRKTQLYLKQLRRQSPDTTNMVEYSNSGYHHRTPKEEYPMTQMSTRSAHTRPLLVDI